MKVGSLFSGGGLGDLGFVMAGCEIVFQVEIDEYCQKILAMRYPDAKKFRDIRAVKGNELPECDIITGGFPCQPFSNAGAKMGQSDDRHLWPEMFRIISEVRPSWVVGENVYGFIDMALDDVLSDLDSIGYETTAFVFPAHALGARHRRERIWIMGYASGTREGSGSKPESKREEVTHSSVVGNSKSNVQRGKREEQGEQQRTTGRPSTRPEDVADTRLLGQAVNEKQTAGFEQSCKIISNAEHGGLPKWGHSTQPQGNEHNTGTYETTERCGRAWWSTEPNVGRVAHGVSNRVHRLKMLGNGQVPFVTKWIAERIMEFDKGALNG